MFSYRLELWTSCWQAWHKIIPNPTVTPQKQSPDELPRSINTSHLNSPQFRTRHLSSLWPVVAADGLPRPGAVIPRQPMLEKWVQWVPNLDSHAIAGGTATKLEQIDQEDQLAMNINVCYVHFYRRNTFAASDKTLDNIICWSSVRWYYDEIQ